MLDVAPLGVRTPKGPLEGGRGSRQATADAGGGGELGTLRPAGRPVGAQRMEREAVRGARWGHRGPWTGLQAVGKTLL